VFELYKEAVSVVNLAAHLPDEAAVVKGGWPRNRAICAGLMIRIAKFMLVVTQLSAKRDRGEVVHALNRSIMESAINLEFLVNANDDGYFDQFVKLSLGAERELYDAIHALRQVYNGRPLITVGALSAHVIAVGDVTSEKRDPARSIFLGTSHFESA
jgi:hypothetical protein